MDMVREMYNDGNNEFFHPSAYRIDKAEEAFYISEVSKETAAERNVYAEPNGNVPTFESRDTAEEYADNNGIELSDFEEIVSKETVSENAPIENVPPEHLEISNEPLNVQLSERLSAEYNFFVSNLMNQKPEVIISSAYEINTKDNIRTYAENEELDLTDEQIKALLSNENVLNEVYQEWNRMNPQTAMAMCLRFCRTERTEYFFHWNVLKRNISNREMFRWNIRKKQFSAMFPFMQNHFPKQES